MYHTTTFHLTKQKDCAKAVEKVFVIFSITIVICFYIDMFYDDVFFCLC